MLADRLKVGDTIGVVAPDKALKSSDTIYMERATDFFKSLGLKVKYGKYLYSDESYCAGTSEQRASDINDMFGDQEVKAIFCAKGGDMANGVLPYLDFEKIKNNPKIFLGFSDNTLLLCAINKMTGLVTFHGQDYIWFGKDEVTNYDKNEIIDKLFSCNKTIIPYDERDFSEFNVDRSEGKLYGTNLICLLKLAGTPYMPDLKDCILFLEGYLTEITYWNAMLEQCNQMGVLTKAIVFGYIYKLQFEEFEQYDIIKELRTINKDVPVIKTNDFGHKHGNSIIPIGVNVVVDKNEKSIVVDNYLN